MTLAGGHRLLHVRAARHGSVPTGESLASIGTTAARAPTEVFLCGTECPELWHFSAGRHDPQPDSNQEGPLRRREERCSQRHFRDHVQRQVQQGQSRLHTISGHSPTHSANSRVTRDRDLLLPRQLTDSSGSSLSPQCQWAFPICGTPHTDYKITILYQDLHTVS